MSPTNFSHKKFRHKNFIEEKYDAEIFFIREANMHNEKIVSWGEEAGIAMSDKSKHKNIIIYKK